MKTSDPRADALRSGYATVAQSYREHLLDELAGKPLDRAFLDAFREGCTGTLLDAGCGPGQIAGYLASRGARVEGVEGVDLSPAMIEQATASHPKLTFRVGDMFALPYETASLGGIAAFYAIVHLRSTELVAPFREFHRVLVRGGLVALAFHVGTDVVHVDELFGAPTSLDFVQHRPEDVIAALVEAGFSVEARLDRAPYPNVEYPSQRTYLLARAV